MDFIYQSTAISQDKSVTPAHMSFKIQLEDSECKIKFHIAFTYKIIGWKGKSKITPKNLYVIDSWI